MEEMITEFERISSYPLTEFIIRYYNFVQRKKDEIVGFYEGRITVADSDAFRQMESLISDIDRITELFSNLGDSLNNVGFWRLLEMIEEFQMNLKTLRKSWKYLKSSRNEYNYNSNATAEYTSIQGQTLEDVSRLQGSINPNTDWSDIARENKLLTEDYSLDFPNTINVQRLEESSDVQISVIFDSLLNERMYGIDLDVNLNIINDDLSQLGFEDTAKQSADILSNLKRGDIPKRPELGLDIKNLVGSNVASFSFPTIIRQITDVFNTDDTFTNLSITEARFEGDVVRFDYEVSTKFFLNINNSI